MRFSTGLALIALLSSTAGLSADPQTRHGYKLDFTSSPSPKLFKLLIECVRDSGGAAADAIVGDFDPRRMTHDSASIQRRELSGNTVYRTKC